MTRDRADQFEYDVAVSFASEDKTTAESLINLLKHKHIEVLRDEYTSADLWGKDVLDHLVNLYARKARYCVILISKNYPLKKWTEAERTSTQERSFRDPNEYIFLIQLDDTEVPGTTKTKADTDLRQHSLESIVDLLEQKLIEIKTRSGPPAKSHDLRSGNIPSTQNKPDR